MEVIEKNQKKLVFQNQIAKYIAKIATEALIQECYLTPKPGLVDRRGSGVHKDMDYSLMLLSAKTLTAYFENMAQEALKFSEVNLHLRETLGAIGRSAEQAMYKVTGGVNTHKGAIWNLGLLVAAVSLNYYHFTLEKLVKTASLLALMPDQYKPTNTSLTHGEWVFMNYSQGGATQEAQQGFPHIVQYAYPILLESRAQGNTETVAQIHTLLSLIATISDTCIIYRCGVERAKIAQKKASLILSEGGINTSIGKRAFKELELFMKKYHISPGGAADLLASTLFLDRILKYKGG